MHNFENQNSIFCTILGIRGIFGGFCLLFLSFFLSSLHVFVAENDSENRDKCGNNKYNYRRKIIALYNAVAENGRGDDGGNSGKGGDENVLYGVNGRYGRYVGQRILRCSGDEEENKYGQFHLVFIREEFVLCQVVGADYLFNKFHSQLAHEKEYCKRADKYTEQTGEGAEPGSPDNAEHYLHRLAGNKCNEYLQQLYSESDKPTAKAEILYPIFKAFPALLCAQHFNVGPEDYCKSYHQKQEYDNRNRAFEKLLYVDSFLFAVHF